MQNRSVYIPSSSDFPFTKANEIRARTRTHTHTRTHLSAPFTLHPSSPYVIREASFFWGRGGGIGLGPGSSSEGRVISESERQKGRFTPICKLCKGNVCLHHPHFLILLYFKCNTVVINVKFKFIYSEGRQLIMLLRSSQPMSLYSCCFLFAVYLFAFQY